MVATNINTIQHNLELEQKHLLEQTKKEVDSEGETNTQIIFLMEQHLSRVEQALRKIESGTYGRCDSCGKPIEPERLEALPEANLCHRCKIRQINP